MAVGCVEGCGDGKDEEEGETWETDEFCCWLGRFG